MTAPVLMAEGLGRDYPTPAGPLTVLDAVDVQIDGGSSLAVVGPSGSGKSTLLGLLAGLDRPSRGRVLVEGRDLAALADRDLSALRARRLGFVFQSHRLIDALDALDNLRVPLDLAGIADADQRARRWLDRVGLGARLNHRPRQLSGGEQQRVAIARALAAGPALVLADEPTGDLDRATAATMADLLFACASEGGAALVMVTHDDELACRCGRRLRISAGHAVEA